MMAEYGISWREIDEWTDRQFAMFSNRLLERKQREAGKGRKKKRVLSEQELLLNPKLMSG